MEENQNQGYGVQPNMAPQEQVGYGVQTPAQPTNGGYGQAPAGNPAPAAEKKPLDWRIIAAIAAVIVIIIVIIILLTGGKKLTCTGEMDGLDAKMTFKFDGDEAKVGLLFRLDDKLNRIKNASELRTNDICDLMGYLNLLLISKGATKEDILKLKD